ncbi:hypothetical protein [Streptomyces sp. NPDC058579]|uniref:hypothetical protein n=1 Tax=Streptomyces sp. NPDC058579 TaxID=3346548 RepID=UPI00365A0959
MNATDTADRSAPSLEADAERQRTLDRLETGMEALQFAPRAHRASPRRPLRRHNLCETHEAWFRLVGPDGQDPSTTLERS